MHCQLRLTIHTSREVRNQLDLHGDGAQVPTDGPQTRDIRLPWENSRVNAARRAFLDRHPLAKNKEQVALAKGEGVLLHAASLMIRSYVLPRMAVAGLLMRSHCGGCSIVLVYTSVHACSERALFF